MFYALNLDEFRDQTADRGGPRGREAWDWPVRPIRLEDQPWIQAELEAGRISPEDVPEFDFVDPQAERRILPPAGTSWRPLPPEHGDQ